MSLFKKIGQGLKGVVSKPVGFVTGGPAGLGGGFKKQYDKEREASEFYKNRFNPYEANFRPELRDKQIAGADRFYNIGMSDELDPMAKAQLEESRRRTQTAERGAREAINQNAYATGTGTGTSNFLSQLLNQQKAADRMSQEGTDIAANQWARSLDALGIGMDAYGGINQDELNRAKLQDMFDQYNIEGQVDSLRNQGDLLAGGSRRRRRFMKGLYDEAKSLGKGVATKGMVK